MTTAAAPRRPSPGDVARRAADRRLTAVGLAHRAVYEQAILASGMNANTRYVAIALATHADTAGHIEQQPRLLGLVHDTGLRPNQVAVALETLQQRLWIRASPAGARYDVADLVLTIPDHIIARLLRKPMERTTDA
ncbi:hypothetical protein ACIRJR_09520 [Streptomyces sp. NPDC102402]|uniref:hypothetical protein n=1 Tax=Streptomyces sp. NPDC102402 TaxID=3366169 RepID=UPI00381CEBA7